MHDHLQQGDGGDSHGFEVLRVFGPGAGGVQGLVCFFIVLVEGVSLGVDEVDGVFEFLVFKH